MPAGWYFAPVHATLTPDGRVLLIGIARPERDPIGAYPMLAGVFPLDPAVPPNGQGELWLDEQAVPVECGAGVPALARARAGAGGRRAEAGPGVRGGGGPARARARAGHWGHRAEVDALAEWGAGTLETAPCGDDRLAYADHLGCSGHTLTAEGRLFVAGGTRDVLEVATGARLATYGLPSGFVYDAGAALWRRVAPYMKGRGEGGLPLRWYPTATRLGDGRILVTAGYERVDLMVENRSVERFDPQAPVPWILLSGHETSPAEIVNPHYPHVFQLPGPVALDDTDYDLLILGAAAKPVLFSGAAGLPAERRWQVRPSQRPGTDPGRLPDRTASAVMLPLRLADGEWGYGNGSVLVAGGDGSPAHRRADTYEPGSDRWGPPIELGVGRDDPATVLLPDLRVLIVAGDNDDAGDGGKELLPQYVDPRAGPLATWGSAALEEPRGYHNVALLLPDGRVLVGGGQATGRGGTHLEQPTCRYYSPAYVGESRLAITAAPTELTVGQSFEVAWDGAAALAEVELLGLGSMTHSLDMNQRAIQLAVTHLDAQARQATVAAPADPLLAPPGPYQLVLLDSRRVPSAGRIVRLRP